MGGNPMSGGGGPQPKAFQRAMIFIDGTNVFNRLRAAKLRVPSLAKIFPDFIGGRQLIRIYLYTIREHHDEAKRIHGDRFFEHIRIVFGEGIKTGDGNIKEKGVDALLVADLVYHAASKNYDYALVVSSDTDFALGIKRVEDFGCRTGVLGVCSEVPQRLKDASDDIFCIREDVFFFNKWAERLTTG